MFSCHLLFLRVVIIHKRLPKRRRTYRRNDSISNTDLRSFNSSDCGVYNDSDNAINASHYKCICIETTRQSINKGTWESSQSRIINRLILTMEIENSRLWEELSLQMFCELNACGIGASEWRWRLDCLEYKKKDCLEYYHTSKLSSARFSILTAYAWQVESVSHSRWRKNLRFRT